VSPELDAKLVADFPDLYADRHGDMRTTAMCWGFACGDGWEPIIRKLSEQLTWLAVAQATPVRVFQVKEKFGTLRFYVDGGTDAMQACISYAEAASARTCEVCGKYGTLRKGGWLQTLCDFHKEPTNV
jgi:hypothetical protein